MGQKPSVWGNTCETCGTEMDHRKWCPCEPKTNRPLEKTGDQIRLEMEEQRLRKIIREELRVKN